MTKRDGEYWYVNQHKLEVDQVFRMYDGTLVKLDHRKPGDGSQWVVATWLEGYTQGTRVVAPGWCYDESTIEPGDLRSDPLPDPEEAA